MKYFFSNKAAFENNVFILFKRTMIARMFMFLKTKWLIINVHYFIIISVVFLPICWIISFLINFNMQQRKGKERILKWKKKSKQVRTSCVKKCFFLKQQCFEFDLIILYFYSYCFKSLHDLSYTHFNFE